MHQIVAVVALLVVAVDLDEVEVAHGAVAVDQQEAEAQVCFTKYKRLSQRVPPNIIFLH